MNPEQLTRIPPFSLLPEAAEQYPTTGPEVLPVIARGGINLYSPPRHCPGYLRLLCEEMAQRAPRFTTRGAVASLWFLGYPLRQLAAEDLTELVFRLGNRFNLHHNRGCDRGIHLGPEHCTRENLALLRGLGFDVVGLNLDATIAGPDRAIEPCQRAIAAIGDFSGMRVQAAISFGPDTSPVYLERLLCALTAAGAEDIDLAPTLPPVHHNQHQASCRQLFTRADGLLTEAGYSLFGDHSFKAGNHPHRVLQANRRLAYGPWGFYNAEVGQWLGLGLGADGLLDGYFYRNTGNADDYRTRLANRAPTEISWSTLPVTRQPVYTLIQQLFCYHRVFDPQSLPTGTRDALLARSWVVSEHDELRLTPEGIRNLQRLMREIIPQDGDDQP